MGSGCGCKTKDPGGDGNVQYLDSISVNILLVPMYFSFAGVCHWGKLDKEYTENLPVLFITNACETTIISK